MTLPSKRKPRTRRAFGPAATEDKFHATYSAILTTWFPTSKGYLIDHQLMGEGGKPEYIIVRRAGGMRNPLLIVELKRLSKWNDAGKREVVSDLTTYIEGRFDLTQYNTIYGLGGIGLNWMVCKMEKSGQHVPQTILDWRGDISSDRTLQRSREFGLPHSVMIKDCVILFLLTLLVSNPSTPGTQSEPLQICNPWRGDVEVGQTQKYVDETDQFQIQSHRQLLIGD